MSCVPVVSADRALFYLDTEGHPLMPELYVVNCSVACDLCGSHTRAEPRGTLCRVLTATAAGTTVHLKGPGDDVVSFHRSRSHSPWVRSFLWPVILLEDTGCLSSPLQF